MNFSAWLTKVTDFVSLGNILTNAGPGMLLALSLLVIGSRVFHLPIFIVAPHGAPLPDQGDASAGEQQDHDHPVIEHHERRVQDLERQLAAAERVKAEIDSQLADVQADAKRLDTEIAATEAQSVAFVRTETLRKTREASRRQSAELASKKAEQENTVQAQRRRLEAAQKQLDSLRGAQNFTASQLLDNALGHLIGITFVGYILGTLLNPISRVLFIEWGSAIGEWRETRGKAS